MDDQASVDQPTVDEPTVDEPTVDQPTADEPTVDQPTADEPTVDKPSLDQPPQNNERPKKKKKAKKRQLQHSADIGFGKAGLPFSKLLEGITECIVGLQYVWEYRSPSKSVPPHYQCKLCAVSRLQHDMLAHVKGWKHCYRYLKKDHPDKVSYEEEEAVKDAVVRKSIKEISAEVEKTEGKGHIKVILKEPSEVPAFKGFRSAIPKTKPQPQTVGPRRPPFNPRFSDIFQGKFPRHTGRLHDYPMGDYDEPGYGGYPNRQDFLDSDMDRRLFPDDRLGDRFGPGDERDCYGRSGLLEENPGRMYPEFQSNVMNSPVDKPMERPGLLGAGPESSNLPNTLLSYLDTFRIENESDAQLVLKVTQKLTDVLMEYRLRGVSKGPSLSPMNFPSSSRLPSTDSRFSSSFSGPHRYYK